MTAADPDQVLRPAPTPVPKPKVNEDLKNALVKKPSPLTLIYRWFTAGKVRPYIGGVDPKKPEGWNHDVPGDFDDSPARKGATVGIKISF